MIGNVRGTESSKSHGTGAGTGSRSAHAPAAPPIILNLPHILQVLQLTTTTASGMCSAWGTICMRIEQVRLLLMNATWMEEQVYTTLKQLTIPLLCTMLTCQCHLLLFLHRTLIQRTIELKVILDMAPSVVTMMIELWRTLYPLKTQNMDIEITMTGVLHGTHLIMEVKQGTIWTR